MASPISAESSAHDLTTYAFDSSVSLLKTIESFESDDREPRELSDELEPLSDVLYRFKEENCMDEDEFNDLRMPLLRCGKACRHFEDIILQQANRSRGPRISFQSWEELRYMNDDIVKFKYMIAGYKATIEIVFRLQMMWVLCPSGIARNL
jgi:hypothetical protein